MIPDVDELLSYSTRERMLRKKAEDDILELVRDDPSSYIDGLYDDYYHYEDAVRYDDLHDRGYYHEDNIWDNREDFELFSQDEMDENYDEGYNQALEDMADKIKDMEV